MTRSIEAIQSNLNWKHNRMRDSQEHAQIIKFEVDIEALNEELKQAWAELEKSALALKEHNMINSDHSPEVKALIEASLKLDHAMKHATSSDMSNVLDEVSAFSKALEKFKPKPAKSPLEKAIALLKQKMDNNWTEQDYDPISFNFSEINILERGLTATEAPVQKWSVPTWDEMPPNLSGVNKLQFDEIRAMILAMNED